ncbi:hypothetical protein HPB50_014353 [Hyalomma asiaticum]|uniref:Uncharacterized protein n=1 Tax=Hyalomma asiaticum TaxID=266040 RepID=A0ACB7SL05_HYAAI|nr:hypothetical protein HPB50_014353 [Hyalomma asiaticum]
MASAERLRKNRGIVRASVMKTVTLLTDALQASAPDDTQVEPHLNYLIQKNVELDDLDKQNTDGIDNNADEKELKGAEEYARKVSYAVSQARSFLRELAAKPVPVEHTALPENLETFLRMAEEASVCPSAVFLSNTIVPVDRYSTSKKLLRVTAWVYHFAGNASKKQPSTAGPLTATELSKAEHYWLTNVQDEMFPEDAQALRAWKNLPSTSPVL